MQYQKINDNHYEKNDGALKTSLFVVKAPRHNIVKRRIETLEGDKICEFRESRIDKSSSLSNVIHRYKDKQLVYRLKHA